MAHPVAGMLPWVLLVAGLSLPGQEPASPGESGVRAGKATVDGIQLQYAIRGAGEPVVLVHAGCFADWFNPLIEERALTDRYRVITYHRIGYAGSTHVSGAVTLVQQAAHLRALLRHLGIARAHIVGHSSGGNIALQLALDAPEMVGTLALLEPAVTVPPSPSTETATPPARPFVPAAIARFRAGDKPGAIDTFMRGVGGADYRAALDARLPGAFAQAIADADTFFGQELPAVQQWRFTQIEAKRISQPVLAVTGEKVRLSHRSGVNGRRCCSSGSRTPKRSSSPAPRTCCTSRIRVAWPIDSSRSSRITDLARHRTASGIDVPAAQFFFRNRRISEHTPLPANPLKGAMTLRRPSAQSCSSWTERRRTATGT